MAQTLRAPEKTDGATKETGESNLSADKEHVVKGESAGSVGCGEAEGVAVETWGEVARGAFAKFAASISLYERTTCGFRVSFLESRSGERPGECDSLFRITNPENRITFLPFSPTKMVRVPPKTASRIPKAWPGPARGAGARRPNHESRKPNHVFAIFAQKNGPGTSEDRKPNPESLARPGPRGRGPKTESRIPKTESRFCHFRPKKWSGYLRRPQAESRKLGPARPEGQGPEDRITNPRKPNHVFAIFAQKNGPGTSEDRKPNPESLARPGPRGRGPKTESRIPKTESRFGHFRPKKWPGYLRRPQAESRKLGPARPEGQGPEDRITNPENRITFLPFSPKKMVRVPPKTASRIPKAWPGPARGAGARRPNHESRKPNHVFANFAQKNGPGASEDRKPNPESLARPGPRGKGPEDRITNPENRITFLPFSPKKMVRVPPKTASRIPKAWPGPARGAGARRPNHGSRKPNHVFAIFAQKNGPGTSEDRKPNPESLARPGPRGRGPKTESRIPENRITFLPFSPKKMVRVPPKTASRIPKAWPGPARGAGARRPNHESRKPNHVFAIFAQKNGPGTSEDRKPNPESLARPGPRGRGPKTESRIPKTESRFRHFRPKKWSGHLRRPQAESRKLGPARPEGQGPEDRITNPENRITFLPISPKKMVRVPPKTASRIPKAWPGPARGAGARRPNHESRKPNHVFAIFAQKKVRVPPKTASRIPKAWPGPARGAGARRPNHESRKPNHVFAIFAQKNGPGTSEDRKPNPESLARPGPRGRGPKTESRIPKTESRFCHFRPKKWSGYLRRPQAESRKLGPARPEGQGPEDRITNPENRITFLPFSPKKMVRVPPKTASRIPKAWPGPARGAGARRPNHESRKPNHVFAIFAQKNGPGTSEDRKPNPESLARPGPRGRGPKTESRIPKTESLRVLGP